MIIFKSYFRIVLPALIMVSLFLLNSVSQVWADIHGHLDADGYWRFNSMDDKSDKYDEIIDQVAEIFEVESSLITAIIKAESDFNHNAVSRKGAEGLMQIMPDTASLMELDDPFNPKENIIAGTRYLSLLLKRFKNNKTLALAAYNAGPETVETYKGVPPFHETKDFIHKVLHYYRQYNRMN